MPDTHPPLTCVPRAEAQYWQGALRVCRIVNVPPMSNRARHSLASGYVLLRKEVIQPHLPVRLPCYDFVPIAGPTFDSSLPQGVRPPASGPSSFHGVTGGVYKARERIHRGVADPRLLAIPTSRSRVADSDPHLDRLLAIGSPSRACDALYRPL